MVIEHQESVVWWSLKQIIALFYCLVVSQRNHPHIVLYAQMPSDQLPKQHLLNYVYVVVNFLFQVIFVFLLFCGMVIYANEVETKEKEKLPEIIN